MNTSTTTLCIWCLTGRSKGPSKLRREVGKGAFPWMWSGVVVQYSFNLSEWLHFCWISSSCLFPAQSFSTKHIWQFSFFSTNKFMGKIIVINYQEKIIWVQTMSKFHQKKYKLARDINGQSLKININRYN